MGEKTGVRSPRWLLGWAACTAALGSIAAADALMLPQNSLKAKLGSRMPSALPVSLSSPPPEQPGRTGLEKATQRKRQRPAPEQAAARDPSCYVRWNRKGDLWQMQTALTTFRRGSDGKVVELHAQQHFGDEHYFWYWNSDVRFNDRHDCVLFELLVDEDLLEEGRGGDQRVTKPVMASESDERLGRNLDLVCQASVLDYARSDKWVHADLSSQEFRGKVASHQTNGSNGSNQDDKNNKNNHQDETTPLWKLASAGSSSAAAEAVAALVAGPPALELAAGSPRKRRLFTNLFLPGGRLVSGMRALLWTTVPSPELSVVLLDWSSLLGGGSGPGALSSVALPVLTSLARLDLGRVRRFLLGQQVLVSSRTNAGPDASAASPSQSPSSDSWSLLVLDRNDHALGVLDRKLGDPGVRSAALLYGSSHCPDLHRKLAASGFRATDKEWRTAWSVREAAGPEAGGTEPLPALGAFLVAYLVVGALDWVAVLGDTCSSLLGGDGLGAAVAVGLYLSRHVLLYLGLSRFLIDWAGADR